MRLSLFFALMLSVATAKPLFSDNMIILAPNNTLSLKSDGKKHDVFIIDYGESFEGHPTFEVTSASGDTSGFEISYAESKAVLDSSYMVRNFSQLKIFIESAPLTVMGCRAMAQSDFQRRWIPFE